MTIAYLPSDRLGTYRPLTEALSGLLSMIVKGERENFTLDFLIGGRHPQILSIQACKYKETLQLEVARRTDSLQATQVEINDIFMKAAGWSIPTPTIEGYPNYIRSHKQTKNNYIDTAELFIDSAIALGEVGVSTWFTFDDDVANTFIDTSSIFWHSKTESSWLCIPGHNRGACLESP